MSGELLTGRQQQSGNQCQINYGFFISSPFDPKDELSPRKSLSRHYLHCRLAVWACLAEEQEKFDNFRDSLAE
jgi:hypothetical protein